MIIERERLESTFTIGERPYVRDGNQNPGPGYYEPDQLKYKGFSTHSLNMGG
jgi:hypothetical protein